VLTFRGGLDLLVGAQDGLPLTTTLLAYQAESEPTLERLWDESTDRRLALLERGVGGTDVSVKTSFDLSINSERMTDESRRLLALLGLLPDGIAHADLDALRPRVWRRRRGPPAQDRPGLRRGIPPAAAPADPRPCPGRPYPTT
jgi:hypothetical protein